ncbi:MAG: pyrroloquinoline quinone biosynthesis peptide chaperone PqqD [Pseudomonadota bacterium]
MSLSTNAIPRLAPHYVFRWEESQAAWLLLYPEGLVKLNGSASEIMQRCDGQRDVATIVAELQLAYADPSGEVERGTLAFLEVACDKGWLRA